jgi:hypothetical protein
MTGSELALVVALYAARGERKTLKELARVTGGSIRNLRGALAMRAHWFRIDVGREHRYALSPEGIAVARNICIPPPPPHSKAENGGSK